MAASIASKRIAIGRFSHTNNHLFALTFDGMLKTAEQVRQDAKECLERWNTEYLTARETFPCRRPVT